MRDMTNAELADALGGEISSAVQRLIAGAFRRDGERLESEKRPRFSIPCRPKHDDDTVVLDALKEAARRLREADDAIARAVETERPYTPVRENAAIRRFRGDFRSMTVAEVRKYASDAQEVIDREEEWVEAATAFLSRLVDHPPKPTAISGGKTDAE
ncbi:hypothetical protein U0C82_03955 [Fulvimarina sp. 2208YS6-2-32]|uniref:Uncharacterized protein n=1 Tax=Fulvimarina uroteuthidis TaxID=3098149 RepID=A0ABU5HYV6_9HYPH|nr:hypothetical protein [Fulvimarina sp. 2208YS6-2-32]MDY8108304.1 hypothetical protein [Fulvimarina sp. 2208YS6-2-32]